MWDAMQLLPGLMRAYTNIIPLAIFAGILLGVVTLGFWRRNRSVRLVSVVFIILSPFIMSSNAGLMLGVPLAEQAIGQAALAAGIAGMLLSFVKR